MRTRFPSPFWRRATICGLIFICCGGISRLWAQGSIPVFALGQTSSSAPSVAYPVRPVTSALSPTDFDLEDFFDEPEFFEEESVVWQLGTGFGSTVDVPAISPELNQIDARFLVPALALTYERQVWQNFGAGVTLGTQMWRVPVLKYHYRYFTLGIRVSYHFNLDFLPELDPYLAGGGTLRTMQLTNNSRGEWEGKLTAHFLVGLRYYFWDQLAAFAEVGQDATSTVKLGLAYYINH